MSTNLAAIITAAAKRNGSDPTTLLADAIQESGLNPNAVGDHGTSFGLYQMHVGGAGGSTLASAKQYLDPMKAIANRARAFKGGSGGAWAASVQRPADQADYAKSVDHIIADLRSGKSPYSKFLSGGGMTAMPATGLTGGSTAMPVDSTRAAALNFIFNDDPAMQSILAMGQQAAPALMPAPAAIHATNATAGGIPASANYKWLQAEGHKLFGLRNDPGDSQTIGGHHTDGSEHYKGRAIDFGTARNSRSQLDAWMKWAKSKGLDVLWEGDHAHVSMPGGGI